jgi:amidohydrolase
MDAKAAVRERIEKSGDELVELSHRIHSHPELGFEEVRASEWLCDALDQAGLKVEKGICELPTAFKATTGSGPLHVAICAEYDCLPGIGHACGHNVIGASAVGALIGLAQVADDAGLTVSVIGTPAEEGGGGKIYLLQRGAFEGAHAAMMVHPAPLDILEPNMIAVSHVDVHYTGKEAHASAFPEEGINAADAITVAQTAIGLLRQHIRTTDRIHGIVTKGGEAPNIVPAHTTAKFYIRSKTLSELETLVPRVYRCFEAGAIATGCTHDVHEQSPTYSEVVHDHDIAEVFRRNAEELGRRFVNLGAFSERAGASTDMGNVSLAIPSIHPLLGINSLPASNHQPEFTEHCATPDADKALMDGAIAMAWTAIDMAADEGLKSRLLKGR